MKIRNASILLGLVVLLAAPMYGDNAALQPLVGTWRCTGVTYASPMGPEHPTEATVHADWVLGGTWLQARYEETKTAKNPHPYAAQMLMMVSAAEKKIVSSCNDNMGGYCSQEGTGWQGDKLTLTGKSHLGAESPMMRDTFTKGKGSFKHFSEVQDAKGAWMKLDEETCRK